MRETWFTPSDQPPFVTEHRPTEPIPKGTRVLEISSRSRAARGRSLSAMALRAVGNDGDNGLVVESVYQGAKCYGDKGPSDRPARNGFDAKRIDRERRKTGQLRGFEHDGAFWPAASGSAFYDHLWIRSAVAAGATKDLKDYQAFTDQFHRPGRAVACQARSAAMLVGLERARLLGKVHDRTDWSDALDLKNQQRPVSAARQGEMQGQAHRMHFRKRGTLPSGKDTLRQTMERHAEAPLVRGGNGPEARDKKLITLPDRKKPTRQRSYDPPGR